MSRYKILIVEDESIEAMNFEQILTSFGFDVVGISTTGKDAIKKVAKLQPDLILMDIVLKGDLDGIDASARIKEDFNIPVVYLTAHPEENAVNRAKLTMPYGYLIKPVSKTDLKNTIELAVYKHQMENKLKESVEKYKTLFDADPDYNILLGADGVIQDVNDATTTLSGLSKEELIGNHFSELEIINKKDMPIHLSKIKSLLRGEPVNPFEGQFIDKNGNIHEVIIHLNTIMKNGNISSILGIATDITEHKKIELSLVESEEKYRTLFDNPLDMITLSEAPGKTAHRKFIEVNRIATERLGYSRDEFLNMTPTDIVAPEKRSQISQITKNLIKFGYDKFESIHLSKDGKRIPVEVYNHKFELNGKNVVLAVSRDITERKKAEKAVKESEAYYRTIFAHSGTATLILEEDNIISMANKECEKLSGYSRKDIEGKKRWTDFVVKDDLEKMEKYHKKRRENSNTVPKAYDFRLINKNGKIKNIHLDVGVIPGTKKSVASLIDFTQLRNAENKIKKSLKEKEVINQVIMQLVEVKDKSEIYSIIGKSIKNLLPCSYVLVTNSDAKMENFQIREAFGLENKINKLNSILGTDIYQMKFPTFNLTEEDMEKFNSSQLISFDGLYDVAVRKIPRPICKIIERVFNVGMIYCIGFSRGGIIYGSLIIILPKGQQLENKDVIETILHQGSITIQRQSAEEMIKTSLREKEVLLKEIHHRVKNNLQIISSLLDLQEDYVSEDATAVNVLKESQNRVLSMAMIHEMIYQSEDLSHINFSDYIRNLTSNLFHSYGAESSITSLINIEQIYLNIETAIPLGLLITELISNSLKYAFLNCEEGKISVEMQSGKNEYKLKISDDGIGIPQEIDFNTESTLGLRLVNSLVNQLDGTIELERTKGTRYAITFKELTYNQRI
jgi:PAS domain S-box-containing protein